MDEDNVPFWVPIALISIIVFLMGVLVVQSGRKPPDKIQQVEAYRNLEELYSQEKLYLDDICKSVGGFTYDFGTSDRPKWKCVKELKP